MDMISYNGILMSEQDLFIKVIDQLNKDLLYSGFTHQFSKKLTYAQFLIEFSEWTEDSVLNKEGKFINFLYRVDVMAKKVIEEGIFNKEKIVKVVLERVLQKIIFRNEMG